MITEQIPKKKAYTDADRIYLLGQVLNGLLQHPDIHTRHSTPNGIVRESMIITGTALRQLETED